MLRPGVEISPIQMVKAREVWIDEPAGFTPWLALPANLGTLAAVLDLDIEFDNVDSTSRELLVGTYSADIVCNIVSGQSKTQRIVIENKFEKFDHDHLGKGLTYLAGVKGAVGVVWIAESFSEPHLAAIELLNAGTSDGLGFFAVQLRLMRAVSGHVLVDYIVRVRPAAGWIEPASVQKRALSTTAEDDTNLRPEYWDAFRRMVSEAKIDFGKGGNSRKHGLLQYSLVNNPTYAVASSVFQNKGNSDIGAYLGFYGEGAEEALAAFQNFIEAHHGNAPLRFIADHEARRYWALRELGSGRLQDREDWVRQHGLMIEALKNMIEHWHSYRAQVIQPPSPPLVT